MSRSVDEIPDKSFIRPNDLDGMAALVAASRTTMKKDRGEKDTAFVKRIVAAYMNADLTLKEIRRQSGFHGVLARLMEES
jgi:hypothetical protein